MPPPSAHLRLSLIVCAYSDERWNDLRLAVESLRLQAGPHDEILVVVDHNPALWLQAQQALTGARVLANTEPRGLSGARNTGLAAARGDIIAFMDEDAVAEPEWRAHLLAPYSQPQVMGVGGAILPAWLSGRPRWFPAEFDWVVGCTYRGLPETAAPVRNLIGCNMSFRREVFEGVGGFRNGIGRIGTRPVGCEETELCIRARQRWPDKQLVYEPRARVRHRVPAQRATWSYFRARCYAEGLSKALIARFVGADASLANERAHALRTLPRGMGRGLLDFVRAGEAAGLARMAAIAAGLAITALGFLAGTLFERQVARDLLRRDVRPATDQAGVS